MTVNEQFIDAISECEKLKDNVSSFVILVVSKKNEDKGLIDYAGKPKEINKLLVMAEEKVMQSICGLIKEINKE